MEHGKRAVENMQKMKLPKGGPSSALAAGAVIAGGLAYAGYHSLYNGKSKRQKMIVKNSCIN